MWARSSRFSKWVAGSLGLLAACAFAPGRQGEALFFGKQPLDAKIRQHESSLPPEVVACANCHGSKGRKLDKTYLLESRQRRGGPPSSYNENKFCKLLRTGADPSYVLISRQMPVYAVTDFQCASLWRFLTTDIKPEEPESVSHD